MEHDQICPLWGRASGFLCEGAESGGSHRMAMSSGLEPSAASILPRTCFRDAGHRHIKSVGTLRALKGRSPPPRCLPRADDDVPSPSAEKGVI